MSGPVLALVVARARNGVIGRAGGLPWRLKSDMAIFKATTMGKPVVMGRKTWASLQKQPLPGRLNIVLSRDTSLELDGAIICERLDEALGIGREQAAEDGVGEVCVIGGEQIFTLTMPKAKRLYVSEIDAEIDGDAWFPPVDEAVWREVRREPHEAGPHDDHAFVFRVLERR